MGGLRKLKHALLRSPQVTDLAVAIVRPVTKRKRKEEIVLFHAGRCGSTVLGDLLNQHSMISWGGEIFRKFRWMRGTEIDIPAINRLINVHRYTTFTPIYGFEVVRQHLSHRFLNLEPGALVELLRNHGISKYLLLRRRNLLRRYISIERGKATRHWHTQIPVEGIAPIPVRFVGAETDSRPFSLADQFDGIEKFYSELQPALSGEEYLDLSYEDDIFEDPLIAYRKICNWLGIPIEHPTVSFRKINDHPYSSLVTNFLDAVKALSDTKYAWMLEESPKAPREMSL